jgi:UDP-glucuronate decarboxylase
LVEAFVRLMDSRDEFTGPVNLGNPKEFTIKELAELVVEMTGTQSKIIYEPLPFDDPKQRQPDITLAKQELGWEPDVPLKEGLVKTIAYFDDLLAKLENL